MAACCSTSRPYITPEAQADFPDGVIASRKVDGKIYGIPMELEPMAFYYSVKAFEDAGLNENDVPKTWDELLELGKKLTTVRSLRPAVRDHARLLPELHLVSVHVAGRRRVPDRRRQERLRLAGGRRRRSSSGRTPSTSGVAPRQVNSGGWDIVANLGAGYCAMQNMGIWGISAMENNAPDVPYGIFKLPVPDGGKYVTVGGGWAFVANAKGKNPEGAGKFIAWALASMDPDSIQREVDWCTVAKSDMPTRTSALKQGARRLQQGQPRHLRQGHPAWRPGRAAAAAGGLQDHLRRHPADPAGRSRSAGDGNRREPAARCVPRHLQGRADDVSGRSGASRRARRTPLRDRLPSETARCLSPVTSRSE